MKRQQEKVKQERRQKLHIVWTLLSEIGLMMSKEQQFKNYLMNEVIIPLTE